MVQFKSYQQKCFFQTSQLEAIGVKQLGIGSAEGILSLWSFAVIQHQNDAHYSSHRTGGFEPHLSHLTKITLIECFV
jgi:hypothetical protein